MENKSKNVAAKILAVMAAVKSVSKDGFNSFHKYKYVTDASIVEEIRTHIIKQGLVIIPNQVECTQVGEITTIKVQYTILDSETSEYVSSHVYGQGQDKGDKGVYKAATGAEKYFLLKTFMLPTDDDPENEKESEATDLENTGVRVPAGYWDLSPEDKKKRLGAGSFAKKTEKGWFIFSSKSAAEKWKQETFTKPALGAKSDDSDI